MHPDQTSPALRIGMLVGTVSKRGGGVIEAVRSLSLALAAQPGVSVEILSLELAQEDRCDLGGVPVRLFPVRGPASFGYAPDLPAALQAGDFDILHVHGLWMYLSLAALAWHRKTGRPYVVSPHGMLDPWALRHRPWKKRLARQLFENAHLNGAACIHALCAEEARAIRSAGFTSPVRILPNGIRAETAPAGAAPWRSTLPPDHKILLFLGRVTPKKKVVELVRAFVSIGAPDWHLVVVGPASADYAAQIAAAAARSPKPGHIHLAGPAYGEARAAAYASADAFILPSISEGLPMAALEAFAFGLPCLLTSQCNLPEAYAHEAALAIRAEEASIASGLERLFAMPAAERRRIGENARRLAADQFDWDGIASRFTSLYRSLSRGHVDAALPDRVRIARAGLPT